MFDTLYPSASKYCLNLISSSSKVSLCWGIKNHTNPMPTSEMALPVKYSTCCPLTGSSKEFKARVRTVVPMAAPALPTAAANPRKCPRMGVGNDSEETKKLQSPGPTERKDWNMAKRTTKSGKTCESGYLV